MFENIKPYAKAVVAYGGAAVATATILLSTNGQITVAQLAEIITAWLTALGVYHVPNSPLAE